MEEVVVVVVEVAVAVAAHHLQRDEREAARPRDEQREHAQLLREHQRSEFLPSVRELRLDPVRLLR